ncbi:hypothetical protein FC87_GL000541 [Fructilactobacillus florum DSM 22689 = JCM 16035]|nr:hypothetical protein FC87_GL000541 [Fructilactobacillus florum DSM 22689 = JCM 16035]
MLYDPVLDFKTLSEAEKTLEKNMVRLIGNGSVIKSKIKYKSSIDEVRIDEVNGKSKIDGLSSKIDSGIKGKWSKKVQEESKKETSKIIKI